MAKRQRITSGAILEVNANNKFYYAQILNSKGCAFFDFESEKSIKDFSILNDKNILFIVRVYDEVISKGKWLKIGNMDIRKNLIIEPFKFIQDSLNLNNFERYNPNTGEITKATRAQVEGLECAAVWEAEHVEDRLRDHYNGIPSAWVQQLAIK